VRPDSDLLLDEAQGVLKRAMTNYPGDPLHVTIYIAHLIQDWNDLLVLLSRADQVTSDPKRVKTITSTVDEHLRREMLRYLDIE
jgi:hypothetical protein